MLIERVVINASPLIILYQGHRQSLLPRLFSDIYIPKAVWSEIAGRGYKDESASGIADAKWIKKITVSSIPTNIASWDLGAGESEVLSFALENPGVRAMIDDKAARRCAKTLGIRTLGTGGMLLLAKRRGLIESVAHEIENLRSAGLWISDQLVELFLKEAREK